MALDEERLGRLIGQAFDRLPEPDMSRLLVSEERILNGRRRTSRGKILRWGLIAALMAGAASAAWWAGGGSSIRPPKTTQTLETLESDNPAAVERQVEPKQTLPKGEDARSPFIFRRQGP